MDFFQETIYPLIIDYWVFAFLLILIVLSVRSASLNHPYSNLRISLAKSALESLSRTFDEIAKALNMDNTESSKIINERVIEILNIFYSKFDSILIRGEELLRENASTVADIFGDSKTDKVWRIGGAIVTAAFLALFIIADVIQAVTALSELEGFGRIVNNLRQTYEILDQIHIAILVSSVGTTAALAYILLDLWGITKFIPWELANQQNLKNNLKYFVSILLILTIFSSVLLGIARLDSLNFNEAILNQLVKILPAFSQVFVLIPMLATTILLSYGIMIIYVIYLIFLGLILLLIMGVRGCFYLLRGLLSAVEPASTPVVGLFLAIFLGALIILAMITGTVLFIADSLFFMVEFLFLTVIGFFRWVASLFNKLTGVRANT